VEVVCIHRKIKTVLVLTQRHRSIPRICNDLSCRALIELLAFNINVPLYLNFRRHKIQRLADDQTSTSVQEHLQKQVLGIYTNAKLSAEATVLQ